MKTATYQLSYRLGIDCDLENYDMLSTKGRENPRPEVTPRATELIYRAKAIDFHLHGSDGPIPLDFSCPTVEDYAYAR